MMKQLAILSVAMLLAIGIHAQNDYKFKAISDIETSAVKSQDRTGTCWCYSTVSFIETELMRMGQPEMDLSEMFIVKKAYEQKADDYIRYHGNANFSQGGQAHDVMNEVIDHGFVPESVYSGIQYNSTYHNHSELASVLSHMLDGVLESRSRTVSDTWDDAFEAVLETYLGTEPTNFTYEGKEYTPVSFMKSTGFNPSDYIELTSYTHHPYYQKIVLEVPDNWSNDLYYNIPLEDLLEVMNYSLKEGYSITWDGDVSHKGFSHKAGVAVVPADEDAEYDKEPIEEINIDAEARQKAFDEHSATDDHLMHLTGLFKDKEGTLYYKTKNSWGTDSNDFGGFLFMSENYIKLGTVAILVHKDAIPEHIMKKLK